MDSLAQSARAAIAEIDRLVAPLQRLSAELRQVTKLRLPPEDEAAVAGVLRNLVQQLAVVAESAVPIGDLAATLKRIREMARG